MATLGKNHGHQWGDSMATSGEKPWPQLGRIRWPLTVGRPFRLMTDREQQLQSALQDLTDPLPFHNQQEAV
jgi:hypothetical protein